MRDYRTMRWALKIVGASDKPLDLGEFVSLGSIEEVGGELRRLRRDGLIEGDFSFDSRGAYLGGKVGCLTEEGATFLKLIENERVWKLILSTLDGAGIDVSYPLLKEVCEEIVKRYVISFVPDISSK